MNFFGHAVVASWTSTEPAFVLGAMVPDFANMVGTRVPPVSHEVVRRGVDFHHATDRVFHDTVTFRELMADARRELRALGLPRPSALAVGHIGVEILLDVSLAADARGSAAYLAALRGGRESELGGHLGWETDDARGRYAALLGILSERGVPRSEADSAAVAFRVARALSRRPRLALTAEGEAIVQAWADRGAPVVAARADGLVREILSGLGEALKTPARDSG
ncbi:MAG TPA: hypothetical protein VHE30_17655 [Polyangiaceae bacterium]|nr:hypothetical protein [Polyangiaceae bacterium]